MTTDHRPGIVARGVYLPPFRTGGGRRRVTVATATSDTWDARTLEG